jgi:hypothetical protein
LMKSFFLFPFVFFSFLFFHLMLFELLRTMLSIETRLNSVFFSHVILVKKC